MDEKQFLEKLGDLIAVPSVTGAEPTEGNPYGEEVSKALNCALDICSEFGFRTKNMDNEIGYAEIGQGEELIGILAHVDVVPEGSGWETDPFQLEVKDGKVFGRGVADDKGPAMAAIFAMKEILESHPEMNKRIRIIFGTQEEGGNWEHMDYYKEHEEIPDYGFTPDADFPAIHCEKGILRLELTMDKKDSGIIHAEGGNAANMVPDFAKVTVKAKDGTEVTMEEKGKSAHGSTPEKGENAISKVMNKLHEANVDSKFVGFYHDTIGMGVNGEQMKIDLSDEVSGRLSFNVGTLFTTEDSVGIVVDIRYPISFELEDIVGKVKEVVKSYNITIEIPSHQKPIYMAKDDKVVSVLMKAYQDVTGDMESEPLVIGGGTYARAMDNIVAFGPLFPGREGTEHQKNEYLYLEDLLKATEIYKLSLENMLNTEMK